MKKFVISLLAATTALTISGSASAATLWDNGVTNPSGGGYCNNNTTGCGIEFSGWTIYDDFQLTSTSTVTGFSYLYQPSTGDYTSTNWSIWQTDPRISYSAGPSYSGTVAGTSSAAGQFTLITASGLSAVLASGTYWLGLQNNLTNNGVSTYAISGTSKLGSAFQIANNDAYRNTGLRDAAFTIVGDIGAVPEPATWAMMILGMGMIGYAMRRSNVKFDAKIKRMTANAA